MLLKEWSSDQQHPQNLELIERHSLEHHPDLLNQKLQVIHCMLKFEKLEGLQVI